MREWRVSGALRGLQREESANNGARWNHCISNFTVWFPTLSEAHKPLLSGPALVQCWASVSDAVPALNHRRLVCLPWHVSTYKPAGHGLVFGCGVVDCCERGISEGIPLFARGHKHSVHRGHRVKSQLIQEYTLDDPPAFTFYRHAFTTARRAILSYLKGMGNISTSVQNIFQGWRSWNIKLWVD